MSVNLGAPEYAALAFLCTGGLITASLEPLGKLRDVVLLRCSAAHRTYALLDNFNFLIEFSEFGVSEFRLNGNEVTAHEQDFENVWVFTAGYWHPLNDKWTIKAGVLYSTQFIKDVNRTQNFKMDQIFGIGVGAEYRWGGNKTVGLNLNFYDLGEAPVEVDIPNIGRLTGRYTKHQSIGLDFTLRWRRDSL